MRTIAKFHTRIAVHVLESLGEGPQLPHCQLRRHVPKNVRVCLSQVEGNQCTIYAV